MSNMPDQEVVENFYQEFGFSEKHQQEARWTKIEDEQMDKIVPGTRHCDAPAAQWQVIFPDESSYSIYYYLSGVFEVEKWCYIKDDDPEKLITELHVALNNVTALFCSSNGYNYDCVNMAIHTLEKCANIYGLPVRASLVQRAMEEEG